MHQRPNESLLTSDALRQGTQLKRETSRHSILQNGTGLPIVLQQARPYIVALADQEPLPSIRKTIHARELGRILLNRNHGERTSSTFRKRHLSSAPRCSYSTESGTRRGAYEKVCAEFFSAPSRPSVSPVPGVTDEDPRREFDSAEIFPNRSAQPEKRP